MQKAPFVLSWRGRQSNYDMDFKECGALRIKENRNTYCVSCKRKHLISKPSYSSQEWSRYAAQQTRNNPDTIQPLKKDGTINKDFVKVYGTKTLEKELKMSAHAIKEEVEKYG